MTKEQECVYDLFMLVEDITDKAKNRDLSLVRPTSGIGAGMYLGMPPICMARDNILEKYEDIIYSAIKAKEQEENNNA